MSKLKNFIVATGVMTCLFAAPASAQMSSVYATFTPSQEQIDATFSATFNDCFALAGINSSGKNECMRQEQFLASARVEESYRAVLPRLPAEQARVLRIEQQSWRRRYQRICISKYEYKNTFDQIGLIRRCILQEAARRTVWLTTRS